jgi:hypothetical protein
MPHLTIAIPDELTAELRDLAHDAYRNPRNQATVLLIEAIRRAAAQRVADDITSPTEAREPKRVSMG